ECFSPDERRRLRGPPLIIARAPGHTFDRNAIFQWQAGQGVLNATLAIPNLHLFRKSKRWQNVGVGPLDADDQNVLAVRRRIQRGDDARLAESSHLLTIGIDSRKLRRAVMIEQPFVMRVLKQVLIGPHRSGTAGAFFDGGTGRRVRRGWRWAALLVDRL